MPQQSNEDLDQLENLLERALSGGESLSPEAAAAGFAALEVIRATRKIIGVESTPKALVRYFEGRDCKMN